MNDTIHVNTMSRLLNALMPRAKSTGTPEAGPFALAMQSAGETSLAAYKEEVALRVQQMSVDPTRTGDNFRIDISDTGYEAMQADPEYERFVLDTIRGELARPNPLQALTGNSTVFLRFGAEPKQFRQDAFSHGDSKMEAAQLDKEKTWWEERLERHRKSMELDEKIADARSAARRLVTAKLQRGESVSAAELSAASEVMSLLLAELLTDFSA